MRALSAIDRWLRDHPFIGALFYGVAISVLTAGGIAVLFIGAASRPPAWPIGVAAGIGAGIAWYVASRTNWWFGRLHRHDD